MRPRLLPDTHLLPSDRGVVISGPRHTAAFALPGIHPWLERLRPFLDGGNSLEQLTADLPPQAARHVRTLVELLAREGFVRDASADLPHTLSPQTRSHHAALIDYIAARADSPEHRFERYRGCAPLVVGSGRVAGALVLALLGSGVAHVRLRPSESRDAGEQAAGAVTDVARLHECVALLRKEGGSFHYEPLSGGDPSELPPDVGVVLFGSDVSEPKSADPARALALRGGLPYGQVVGRGEHVVISAVRPVQHVRCPSTPAASKGVVPHRRSSYAECPAPVRRPSPYLGGPMAALAANQLCLRLLRTVAGLDHIDGPDDPSATAEPAVLDLATGRFLGTEPE
ncbi:hypothetical protein ACWGNF_01740 [Streptomyces sp. NPDC055808]